MPSAEVAAIFDEALDLGERLMAPRLVYRAEPVTAQGASWIDAGGERLEIPEIGRLWGRLQAVGAGICTVGDAIEGRVRELFDARELPLAVMLDSVGSAAVESLAEHANDLLCQAGLRAGLNVTNRISPGYAGWDTGGQRGLFRLCPGHPIGVVAQPGVRDDAGQDHLVARGGRPGSPGRPLLHPVPPLLDEGLRLPACPRDDDRPPLTPGRARHEAEPRASLPRSLYGRVACSRRPARVGPSPGLAWLAVPCALPGLSCNVSATPGVAAAGQPTGG